MRRRQRPNALSDVQAAAVQAERACPAGVVPARRHLRGAGSGAAEHAHKVCRSDRRDARCTSLVRRVHNRLVGCRSAAHLHSRSPPKPGAVVGDDLPVRPRTKPSSGVPRHTLAQINRLVRLHPRHHFNGCIGGGVAAPGGDAVAQKRERLAITRQRRDALHVIRVSGGIAA